MARPAHANRSLHGSTRGRPVTAEPRNLIAAYASLVDPDGIAFYGSAQTLRELAQLLDNGSPIDIALAEAPRDVVEGGAIRGLLILPASEGPLELRANNEVIEIAGGLAERRMLASTLENLALEPPDEGPVPRHVDLEYFDGHSFLGESSMWMSLFLLPESTE